MGEYADIQIEKDRANLAKLAATDDKKRRREIACPICRKHVKEIGLSNHMRDAHGTTPPTP